MAENAGPMTINEATVRTSPERKKYCLMKNPPTAKTAGSLLPAAVVCGGVLRG